MAEFLEAFERTMKLEGGYTLHNVAGDRGGMTYAGIARNFHPTWPGWALIDSGRQDPDLTRMVRDFYFTNFWQKVRGPEIKDQQVANHIYDFAVNAGPGSAIKLAQIAFRLTPDGVIGPKTLDTINSMDPEFLILAYAFAKVVRYAGIVNKDRSQGKFLLGWILRTIQGVR